MTARANREVQMLWTPLRAILFGLTIIAISISPSLAFKKTNLPGTRSKDYMKDLCSSSHGQYVEGQGQYGCVSNCGDQNRESDACGINCSDKTNKCYGWTPARKITNRSPKAILHPSIRSLKSSGK
jgi:hypothetical protein